MSPEQSDESMPFETPRSGLGTRSVHAGAAEDPYGAPHPPLYDHTTFATREAHEDDGARRAFYTRYGDNPTLWAVEDKVASLHEADRALVHGSGMAAMSASLLALLAPGDHVVAVGALYGGTQELASVRLASLGITSSTIAPERLARLHDLAPATTRVVLLESPSNPLLEVVDLRRAADAAHALGARLVVDNTFATPVNQRPLVHGADVVVESATKYLGGHSDLTGGVVVGAGGLLDRIAGWRTSLGQVMAPEVAHRLSRSLRTLPLRVARQNATATTVAAWLATQPQVRRVLHPSLATGQARAVVDRQMSGPGGMLTFELLDDAAAATMIENLELVTAAPSLGGVETLVAQPSRTSHRDLPEAERHRLGITNGLVRLSIGLEDEDDLLEDLATGLRAIRGA